MPTTYVGPAEYAGNGYFYQAKRNPDGSIGVDYFDANGAAIHNTQFSEATGIDNSMVEENIRNGFENADLAKANYALGQGAQTNDSGGTPISVRSAAAVPRYEAGDPGEGTEDVRAAVVDPYAAAAAAAKAEAEKEAAKAELEKQYEIGAYQRGIDDINRLLGTLDAQRTQGVADIGRNYTSQAGDLKYKRDATMDAYGRQTVENNTDKAAGIADVDRFANRSYNSLMRLLGGAGAGNSSAARTVVPTLVSRAGNTRRQEVFNTAGENQANIDTAAKDATWQYDTADRDLNDWKAQQERELDTGIANTRADLLSKLLGYEMDKKQAEGKGYDAARMAARTTQGNIDSNRSALDALFGATKTAAPVRQFETQNPTLNKYTLDQASININNANPNAGGYYGSMLPLKKKQPELTF